MATNSVKHTMLQLAKKIANTEYKDRVEMVKNPDTLKYEKYITPATAVRNEVINYILKDHPEFDGTEFRSMIKEFKTRNTKEDGHEQSD